MSLDETKLNAIDPADLTEEAIEKIAKAEGGEITTVVLGLSAKAAEYVLECISQRQTYEGPTYVNGVGTYDELGMQISAEIDSQLDVRKKAK